MKLFTKFRFTDSGGIFPYCPQQYLQQMRSLFCHTWFKQFECAFKSINCAVDVFHSHRSRKDINPAAAGKNTKVEQFQMQKLRKVSGLKTSMISRRPPNAPTANPPPIFLPSAVRSGFSISGEWDPLGMRGTVSRNLRI
jgi:hypothetical protein